MDKLLIEGGIRLNGEVLISGSKNASLPILAATLMVNGVTHIKNVPFLSDVKSMLGLLEHLGAKVTYEKDAVLIDNRFINNTEATYDIVRKMRASICVLGPLLTRFGQARVSLPGGCAIGTRPIDLHLNGLICMGANITIHEGYVEANIPKGKLQGCNINLDFPSVGATENLMMAAALAEGVTIIENAACDPEIIELAKLMMLMGVEISGVGTSNITVKGINELKEIIYEVGPDRLEVGTFIAASAITQGDLVIRGVKFSDLHQVLNKFRQIGCEIIEYNYGVEDFGDLKVTCNKKLQSIDIKTAPYPGFPTDLQPQFMACMTIAKDACRIKETIFENRFMHVSELNRLGANITIQDSSALVKGVAKLKAAPVMATDLRAGAGLVLAALCAEGISEIKRVYHLDRGYVALENKLSALNAKIVRMKDL